MDFWDTFLPTFLANILALLLFGSFWASLNRRARRRLRYIANSVSRSRREWLFRARFLRLVFKGRRRWREYDNWMWSERVRQFYARVIYEAPAARAYSIRNMVSAESIKRFREIKEWQWSPESAFVQLVDATGKLTLGESGSTPSDSTFRSMSPREKAQFLIGQPPNVLLPWVLKLSKGDRRAWQNWLNSEECLTHLEAVFSKSKEP